MNVKVILPDQSNSSGGSGGVELHSITIDTPPTKTSYITGETFDPTGMVVTAHYYISTVEIATAAVSGYTISPQTLSDGDTSVTITYVEAGQKATITQAVSVTHRLTAISVTTAPTKTVYEYGDSFATGGMVVTATYSDNTTAAVNGYTYSPTGALSTLGSQDITISYTENGYTETCTQAITVERKRVPIPNLVGSLTYTGSAQAPSLSGSGSCYWNNYNSTYMTVEQTSQTNAATSASAAVTQYETIFTPTANYQWSDSTTAAKALTWTIARATGTLSVSPTSVAINASNYSSGVAVTASGNHGTLSVSGQVTGITTTVSGNIITVKGNGSTATSTTLNVTAAQAQNYTAVTTASTISVTATYWSWGDETAVGDATWWAGLKTWAANASASERAAVVGKKKKVTMTTAFQGLNNGATVSMICIGADNDGTGTLTFQTEGTCPTSATFGSSSGLWASSTVKTLCETFATNNSASASIKQIIKLSATATNSSQSGAASGETTCKGWLPSDCEMGFTSGHDYNNGKGYAASYSEWTKGGSGTAYAYYNSNARRIKYAMSADGTIGTSAQYYWERSVYYASTSGACRVDTDGKPDNRSYDGSSGLAPAYTIG